MSGTHPTYDAIVVGCGSVGSAALYTLAQRGLRVLGLDRFDVPHRRGSHHGSHRIYRFAYAEGASYVPLMRAAHERWMSLEARWHDDLHLQTGGLDLGFVDGRQVAGSIAACVEHDLEHEVLDAREVQRRFPAWRLPSDAVGVFQADAGMLFPERCVKAHCTLAITHGAEVHPHETVDAWQSDGDRVTVETANATYEAGGLILTAGAWNPGLVSSLAKMTPTRQIVCWITPNQPELVQPDRFPVWLAEFEPGAHFYGFAEQITPGMKLGWHDAGAPVDPTTMDRTTTVADEAAHRRFVESYLPSVTGPTLDRAACMYTMSPDEHFVLDTLPGARNVAVFSGDSGHGFKFASELGAICADLVTVGATLHDLSMFRLDRQ
jgi:sarcosine oxidase